MLLMSWLLDGDPFRYLSFACLRGRVSFNPAESLFLALNIDSLDSRVKGATVAAILLPRLELAVVDSS